MYSPNRKKALIFGTLLVLAALFTPSLSRICQATAAGSRAAHPCCQDKTECGPQFNSESCCKTPHASSHHSIPLQQANPEIAKFFPLLSLLTPTVQAWGNLLQHAATTFAAFPIPPPFLAHHAFLC
jgi:hypothetical protein